MAQKRAGQYGKAQTDIKSANQKAADLGNKQASSGSSSGSKSNSGSSSTVKVGADGNAQKGLSVGTIVETAGGNYQIVAPNTPGATYNPASGYWSVKTGTNDTSGAMPAWLAGTPGVVQTAEYSTNVSQNYYDKALQEQQKAIKQQMESAITANNAYIPRVNQQSDKSLQNAYILREQARVNAPEALAALGLHGGASETHLMGINTNYENTRNQVEQSRNQALDNIYQNELRIRSTGDASLADASANYYNQLIAAQQAAQAQLQQQANWEAEFGLKQQDYENRLAQQAWDNWYNEQLLGLKQTSANKSTGGSSGGGGSGGGGGTTDKNISGNYNVVLNNVKRALGGSNAGSQAAFDAVVNYIQNSLRQGMITEYEAQQMINQLGLS